MEESKMAKKKDEMSVAAGQMNEAKKAEILPETAKRILDDDRLKYELINDRQFS